MTLGQRLKTYREKEGLTQEQFAEYLNVSRQAVTKWEHDAGMPDIENLVAISRRMGVTLDELVLGPPSEERTASLSSAKPQAVPPCSAGTEPEQGASFASASVLSSGSAPLDGPASLYGSAPSESKRGAPSERARYHAFAALAFVFAAFCQAVAGCVALVAAFNRRAPEFLPILNFCSAVLCLFTAYVQAVRCSRYRQEQQKNTTDP